ncbi:hypothetical protein NX059_004038 [Plenodomus lindquistii]|nr:hypothetical protein NX059_004038 [Plenodomus lindquistii]
MATRMIGSETLAAHSTDESQWPEYESFANPSHEARRILVEFSEHIKTCNAALPPDAEYDCHRDDHSLICVCALPKNRAAWARLDVKYRIRGHKVPTWYRENWQARNNDDKHNEYRRQGTQKGRSELIFVSTNNDGQGAWVTLEGKTDPPAKQ